MNYGRRNRTFWRAGGGLALGAAAATMAALLSPSIAIASGQSARAPSASTAGPTNYNCSARVQGSPLSRNDWVASSNTLLRCQ